MRIEEDQNGSDVPVDDQQASGDAHPVGVLVELRVPKAQPSASTLESPALEMPGFDLDRDYEPIPTTPTPELAASLEAAGQEVVTVRGVIEESRIPELESREEVIQVWRDTRAEAFPGP